MTQRATRLAADFDASSQRLVHAATERIRKDMGAAAPEMARHTWKWMRSLAGGRHPASYYTARWDYPILLLPCWLDRRIGGRAGAAFRRDIVYSTVNGYYFLRLCDNLMDDEATVETELLPAAAFFHTEFQSVYSRAFRPNHAFWRIFRKNWFGGAEAALVDRRLSRVDEKAFRTVAARKTCAAKIPIAAVCLHHGRADLWPAWNDFSDRLARFIQMADDLFDWIDDSERGPRSTYFLSEADKRRGHGESESAWIANYGFGWGLDTCLRWLADLRRRAKKLDCPEMDGLLAGREATLAERGEAMKDALRSLRPLAVALGEAPSDSGERASPAGARKRTRQPLFHQ